MQGCVAVAMHHRVWTGVTSGEGIDEDGESDDWSASDGYEEDLESRGSQLGELTRAAAKRPSVLARRTREVGSHR